MKKHLILAGAVLSALIGSRGAHAQPYPVELSFTGQPATVASNGLAARVDGYGNARFGMSAAEVMAVIARDFPGARAEPGERTDPVSGVHGIGITLDALAPAPGPANISYVFGASSKRLVAVHVTWLVTGVATRPQQDALTAAATQLTVELLRYEWPFMAVTRGFVVAPGTLVLFSGQDRRGGAAEVRLIGTAFTLEQRRRQAGERPMPELPPGMARLSYSLVANRQQPDVAAVAPR